MRRYGTRAGAIGAGLLLIAGLAAAGPPAGTAGVAGPGGVDVDSATIPDLQKAMNAGRLTSLELTRFYIDRIRRVDRPLVHSVLAIDSEAEAQARASDQRRRANRLLGPLDGIPVLLKDNVNRGRTTAGSLALLNARPADAFIVGRLRAAGGVILGKANLSEWANFRSSQSSSGWSAVGGQTNNPYALDHNPCGSSSGSGAAAAADMATVAIGTETDGSIVCPSGANGLVGLKPTIGRVSRTGIVPISAQQDTAGPMTRNVTDTAIVLNALKGTDPADPPTAEAPDQGDYTRNLDRGALRGARIGVWRAGNTGASNETDAILDRSVAALRRLGATVVDPVVPPNLNGIGGPEFEALLCEFKHDINAYLAATPGPHPRTLAELIAFNNAQAAREMPFFNQEVFEAAQETSGDLDDPACANPRRTATTLAKQAIDQTVADNDLDAIVAPTGSPAWTTDLINGDHFTVGSSSLAAVSGYPNITVPAGEAFRLPVGLSFMAGRFSEPRLLGLAFSFEQGTRARRAPALLRSAPATDGIRPWPPGSSGGAAVGPEETTRFTAPGGPVTPGRPHGAAR